MFRTLPWALLFVFVGCDGIQGSHDFAADGIDSAAAARVFVDAQVKEGRRLESMDGQVHVIGEVNKDFFGDPVRIGLGFKEDPGYLQTALDQLFFPGLGMVRPGPNNVDVRVLGVEAPQRYAKSLVMTGVQPEVAPLRDDGGRLTVGESKMVVLFWEPVVADGQPNPVGEFVLQLTGGPGSIAPAGVDRPGIKQLFEAMIPSPKGPRFTAEFMYADSAPLVTVRVTTAGQQGP